MAQSDYRSDTVSDLKNKAANTLKDAADQAEGVVNRVTEQGREVKENMGEVAGNIKGAVDKSVKDQPMATLAFAGMIGFVLGALWKS